MEKELLLCECGSSEHQMVIRYLNFELDAFVSVDIYLTKRSFWGRLKYAIKYIFGYKSKYGAWDEIILNHEHIKRLESVIKYLKDSEAKKLQGCLFN